MLKVQQKNSVVDCKGAARREEGECWGSGGLNERDYAKECET